MSQNQDHTEIWMQHFSNLKVDVQRADLRVQPWKDTINVINLDVYHAVAQAYDQTSLKVNLDRNLFFKTEQVPDEIRGEWTVCFIGRTQDFKDKYGSRYNIRELEG